jgi:regulatory protein
MALGQKKVYNLDEAREKIRRYCAYQERSQKQVHEKLRSYGLIPNVADELFLELLQDDFVNEERFAIAFARGRANIKYWGRRKVEMELRQHGVSKPCVAIALAAIDQNKYADNIQRLALKKYKALKGERKNTRKQKTINYLISKGYIYDEINEVIKNIGIE